MEAFWNKKSNNIEEEVIKQMKYSYGDDLLIQDDIENFLSETKEVMKNKDILKNICKLIVQKMDFDWKEFF